MRPPRFATPLRREREFRNDEQLLWLSKYCYNQFSSPSLAFEIYVDGVYSAFTPVPGARISCRCLPLEPIAYREARLFYHASDPRNRPSQPEQERRANASKYQQYYEQGCPARPTGWQEEAHTSSKQLQSERYWTI